MWVDTVEVEVGSNTQPAAGSAEGRMGWRDIDGEDEGRLELGLGLGLGLELRLDVESVEAVAVDRITDAVEALTAVVVVVPAYAIVRAETSGVCSSGIGSEAKKEAEDGVVRGADERWAIHFFEPSNTD